MIRRSLGKNGFAPDMLATDSLRLVESVNVPNRILRALDAIGVLEGSFVDKVLLLSDSVSMVEVAEIGAGGKKPSSFVLGDLVIQSNSD